MRPRVMDMYNPKIFGSTFELQIPGFGYGQKDSHAMKPPASPISHGPKESRLEA